MSPLSLIADAIDAAHAAGLAAAADAPEPDAPEALGDLFNRALSTVDEPDEPEELDTLDIHTFAAAVPTQKLFVLLAALTGQIAKRPDITPSLRTKFLVNYLVSANALLRTCGPAAPCGAAGCDCHKVSDNALAAFKASPLPEIVGLLLQ